MDISGICIPDGIEPIVGWRYWQSDGQWLCSLHRFKTWPAGQALRAGCPYPDTHGGPSPDQACGCGLYAALDLPTLRQATNADLESPLVVGEVALWGRVIPAELGYRAQFGYPRRLWVVRESIPVLDGLDEVPARLARRYRVPVELCDATWAVSAAVLNPWSTGARSAESRSAVVTFKAGVDRLARALLEGEDAYRTELDRLRADERAALLARQAFRDQLPG